MKINVLIMSFLAVLAVEGWSQEVIIRDFPMGVAGSIDTALLASYYPDLKAISDTLHKYPLMRAIITGGADGAQYRHDNDAKNPGLAVGRAHVLYNLLVHEFQVDSTQVIIQSADTKLPGPQYRYTSVRITRELSDLESRLAAIESRPPVEKHFTEIRDTLVGLTENLGLRFGLGVSTSPFGGIPIATCAVTWKRIIHIEGMVGHTIWNETFRYGETTLDTKRRLIGGHVAVYPDNRIPIGIMGGWVRIEEIAQKYYEYVKMSEGLLIGLKAIPFEFLSIIGAYNPSKHRRTGEGTSNAENDQFLFALTANIAFGGAK